MAARRSKKPIFRRRRAPETCVTHNSNDVDHGTAMIEVSDPLALISLARENPVLAARQGQTAMTTLQTGFNEHQIGIIGTAYASAYYMTRADSAWEQFLKDPGWAGLTGKPKNTLRHRKRMLHHVMRYVFQAEAKSARDRVRVYANMLVDRFNENFPPDDVVPLIKRYGIEALRREGEARRRAARKCAKDSYFSDLRNLGKDDAVSAPSPTTSAKPKLTQAQIKRLTRDLVDLNVGLMRLWKKHSE